MPSKAAAVMGVKPLGVHTSRGFALFLLVGRMERGWIKLWRKTVDSGILQHGKTLQVFIWLLIHATHKEENRSTRYGIVKLQPGQVLIGRDELARVLKLSSRNTRTALKLLKTTGVTTTEATSHFSIITLVKWVDYQGQPHKVTNETTGQVTNSRPTADQQLTTEQECKNKRIKEKDQNLPPNGGNKVESPETQLTNRYIAAWIDCWRQFRRSDWAFEGKGSGRLKSLLKIANITLMEFKRRAGNYLTNPKRQSGFTLFDFVETWNKWDVATLPEGFVSKPLSLAPLPTYHLPKLPPEQEAKGSILEGMIKELKQKKGV